MTAVAQRLANFTCCVPVSVSNNTRPRIDRSMIGGPTNFIHIAHLGKEESEVSSRDMSLTMQSKGNLNNCEVRDSMFSPTPENSFLIDAGPNAILAPKATSPATIDEEGEGGDQYRMSNTYNTIENNDAQTASGMNSSVNTVRSYVSAEHVKQSESMMPLHASQGGGDSSYDDRDEVRL